MPRFSDKSLTYLRSCDHRIQDVCHKVIVLYDFSVVEGHRGQVKQNEYHEQGLSNLKWPDSKHNKFPSLAVHCLPYPGGWKADKREFCYLAGLMVGVASEVGITLRWGGNWDMDSEILTDQQLDDYAHFELAD